MPPEKPRQTSPGLSGKAKSTSADPRRKSMPPPTKSKKRKADDDHEDVYKVASTRGFKLKGSGGKKMKEMLGKVEEGDSGDAKYEDEEEEEEEEKLESRRNVADSQSQSTGVKKIVADMRSEFTHTLKPKKREDNITKLTGKFDDVYTTIETKMEERDAGEKGVPAKSESMVNTWNAVEQTLHDQERCTAKLRDAIASRVGEVFVLQNPLEQHINQEHSLLIALEETMELYTKRPKAIQAAVQDFQKKQRKTVREAEEKAKAALDVKQLIRAARKFVAATR